MLLSSDSTPSVLLTEDQSAAPGTPPDLPAAILATLACQGRDPGAPGAPGFTLIQSKHKATKTYRANDAGRPEKEGDPFLSKGVVYRASLSASTPLAELAGVLGALPFNVVLVCGTLAGSHDEVQLTTKDKLEHNPGAITRTKGFATYPKDRRGLVMLDHDAKDLDDGLRARLDAAGGLVAVLTQLCPEIARAGLLTRPSVSTGIRATATGSMTPGGGRHLYLIAEDGADVPAFIKRLHQRLVLAGWGWVFISETGSCQIRSLIDTAASGNPERLAFEADAVLGAGLEYADGARGCVVERDGAPLQTTTLPELDAAALVQLATVEADLRATAAPRAAPIRAAAKQKRAATLVALGMAPAEAQARVARAFDGERLDTAETVHLDDGRTPTIADILRNPLDYDGATGADPLEPNYGGGRNKAIWYTTGLTMRCHSYAHGGQLFEVGWTARDLIEEWEAKRNPAGLQSMYLRTLLDDPDADQVQLAAAGVPTWAGLDFGLDALADLAGMVAREEGQELAGLKAQLRGAFADARTVAIEAGQLDGAALAAVLLLAEAVQDGTGAITSGWQDRIVRGKSGQVPPTLTNALIALGQGCGLVGHLRLDRASQRFVLAGVPAGSAVWRALSLSRAAPFCRDPLTGEPVFAWSDTMTTTALHYLEGQGVWLPSRRQAEHAISSIAMDGAYSSVGRWLRSLVWDRRPRLDGWLVRHAAAFDTCFNGVALSRWMIGAVARALCQDERGDPAQMDTALVLVGDQGAGKSRFFRGLCPVPQWHTESSLGNLSGKDAPMTLAAHWLVDMAEGSSVKANSVDAFKQFMTTLYDSFRPPYGRHVVQNARRNVFAMTVNEDGAGFLRDGTGNRRFWVVEVEAINIVQLQQDRDQLWAEAVARFDAEECWWFDQDNPQDAVLIEQAAAAAEGHRVQTSIETLLRRYVAETPPAPLRGSDPWMLRASPLTVMGAADDVLRAIGQAKALDYAFGAPECARALASMGWKSARVTLRNAPVERNRTVWVDPSGKKTLAATRRLPGAFQTWLEASARAGTIGLHRGAGLNAAWYEDKGVSLPLSPVAADFRP